MFTPITQMFTCYTVKPKGHKCGLNSQIWIDVGEYHKDIYNNTAPYNCPKPFSFLYTIFPNLAKTANMNLKAGNKLLSLSFSY